MKDKDWGKMYSVYYELLAERYSHAYEMFEVVPFLDGLRTFLSAVQTLVLTSGGKYSVFSPMAFGLIPISVGSASVFVQTVWNAYMLDWFANWNLAVMAASVYTII